MTSLKLLHIGHQVGGITNFADNKLGSLKTLDASYNNLGSFPTSNDFKSLITLNLAVNSLASFTYAPLNNLLYLDLTSNQLTSLDCAPYKVLLELTLKKNPKLSSVTNIPKTINKIDMSETNISSFNDN